MDVHTPKYASIDVKIDGLRVCIVKDKQVILSLPWDAALMLSKVLRRHAQVVEEIASASKIAYESAVLIRKGMPFSLTDHPAIAKEAEKEAAWNRDLRRYIPGSVKSQARVGTPKVHRDPPRRTNAKLRGNDK